MEIIRETARAKVNFTLPVLARQPDGYHEVDTVMHAISLADEVELRPAEGLSLTIEETPRRAGQSHVARGGALYGGNGRPRRGHASGEARPLRSGTGRRLRRCGSGAPRAGPALRHPSWMGSAVPHGFPPRGGRALLHRRRLCPRPGHRGRALPLPPWEACPFSW